VQPRVRTGKWTGSRPHNKRPPSAFRARKGFTTPRSMSTRCTAVSTRQTAVTAQADWTATNAKWQGATSEGPNPSMYLDPNNDLVINWQDNRTYCSSGGAFAGFDDVCRYINYPMSYQLTMEESRQERRGAIRRRPRCLRSSLKSVTRGMRESIGTSSTALRAWNRIPGPTARDM
jgi:hypothetical protein